MSKIEVKEECDLSDEDYEQDLDLLLQEDVTEFLENTPSPLKTEEGNGRGKRKSGDDDSEKQTVKVKKENYDEDPDKPGRRRTPQRHRKKGEQWKRHERERMRKRRQNETAEERRKRLDKDKERGRLRRERLRLERNEEEEELKKQENRKRQKQRLQNETEEQRQRRLNKLKENGRLYHEKKRLSQNETEEERRTRLDKAKERVRRRRARERLEQNEEEEELKKRKKREQQRQRIQNETEEQRRIRLEKDKERTRLRRARERLEQNEEEEEMKKRENRERQRQRRQNETEEERQIRLDKGKKIARLRRERETEEERQRRLESLKEAVKRRRQHQTEEQKQRVKVRQYLYMANLTKEQRQEREMKRKLYWYSIPKEKREENTKRYVETFRNRRHNFTKEEKERYMESVYRALKKYTEKRKKDPEKREKWNAYIRARHQKAIANETPEKRQKRLWKYKVNAAKSKLKQQLFSEGVPPEEIEKRAKELHDQMWSQPLPIPSSDYKPRPRKRKGPCGESQQITPNDTEEDSNSIGFPFPATQLTQVMPVSIHAPYSLQPPLAIPKLQMWSQPLPANHPSMYSLRSRQKLTTACSESNQKGVEKTVDSNSIGFPGMYSTTANTSCSHDSQLIIQKLDNEEENGGYEQELDIDADFEDHYAENTTFSPISQENQDSKSFTSTSNDSSCDGNNLHDHIRTPPTPSHTDMETFSAEDTLEDEPSKDHSIKCLHCTDSFSNDTELRLHVKSQHFNLCWKCPKCKDLMLNPSEMSEHFKTKHFATEDNSKPSQVEVGKTENNKPTRTFNCVKCPVQNSSSSSFVQSKFSSLKDLSCHVQENHPEAYWPCSHCSILKYSEKSLKIHLKVCRKKIK